MIDNNKTFRQGKTATQVNLSEDNLSVISQILGILAFAGIFSGVLAGFLGIGGGTVLVPLLVSLGYTPLQAVATSSLAILITSISASIQNWRMGYFKLKPVIYLGFPALVTAQIGVYLAKIIPPYLLLMEFGILLLSNIYLVELRKQLTAKGEKNNNMPDKKFSPIFSKLATGAAAGILAGLFGVGGGVIIVPLQILLLGETIKAAIQNSLGVIVIISISACIGHALNGNVLFVEGMLLGTGGFLGVQMSTRILPKLPDEMVNVAFKTLLSLLSVYVFLQAGISYLRFLFK